MKVITETRRIWWRLLQKHVVPDEGYYRNMSYLMKVITETRRTWWRLLQKSVVPDEGYYRNTSYLMKVITETRRTWWRLLQKSVVPEEGYYRKASCTLNKPSTFYALYNIVSSTPHSHGDGDSNFISWYT
jgi:hypothetical protein